MDEPERKKQKIAAASAAVGGDQPTGEEDFAEETLNGIVQRGSLVELDAFIANLNAEIKSLPYGERRDELVGLLRLANDRRKTMISKLKDGARITMERIVPFSYGVSTTELSDDIALTPLYVRVKKLFEWYVASDKKKKAEKDKYRAPYFPIVQSSGTGKTKLLYEVAKKLNDKEGDKYRCVTVLCDTGIKPPPDGDENDEEAAVDSKPQPDDDNTVQEEPTHSHIIDFEDEVKNSGLKEKFQAIETVLDAILKEPNISNIDKVVLMFDEAQMLLVDSNLKPDSFKFRCVRWWLRKPRPTQQVVAVFTGTTSALANYYEEPKPGDAPSSRDLKGDYLGTGNTLYDPFYQLGTAGCLSRRYIPVTPNPTDFDIAVAFGRPLFALLHQKGELLQKENQILRRMALSQEDQDPGQWTDELAYVSVLATRVQMDVTVMKKLSTLVSRGYANLMDFQTLGDDGYHAKICYDPDPVLSRLSMCLMDEDWQRVGRYNGRDKLWWVKTLKQLLAGGLYHPPKGDVGELFAALYMLFCGDEIRKSKGDNYRTFSIPLNSWVKNLLENKGSNEKSSDLQETRTCKILRKGHKSIASSEIAFIQVCRNYLRYPFLFKKGIEVTVSQRFLKHLYQSGCACYTFPGSWYIDMLASIRVTFTDKSETYRPLIVSVKSQTDFAEQDALAATDVMRGMLKQGGLCILIVFGGGPSCTTAGDMNWEKALEHIDTTTVTVVVRVKDDDKFGLLGALNYVASFVKDAHEILASTAMLRGHERTEFRNDSLLRSHSSSKGSFKKLRDKVEKWYEHESSLRGSPM